MPFKIGDRTIPIDTPFIAGDIQYPANWIRLATEEDKAAIGLVWEADPVRANDSFYWDGDLTNPKPLDDIKSLLVSQIKATAGSMLSATDWKIIREAEGVKPAGQATLDDRSAIRDASNANEAQVMAATSVDELAVMSFTWPNQGGV